MGYRGNFQKVSGFGVDVPPEKRFERELVYLEALIFDEALNIIDCLHV